MKPSPQRKGKGASRTPPPTPYIVIGTNVVGAVYATATVGDKRLPPATIAPRVVARTRERMAQISCKHQQKKSVYKTIGDRIFVLSPIE